MLRVHSTDSYSYEALRIYFNVETLQGKLSSNQIDFLNKLTMDAILDKTQKYILIPSTLTQLFNAGFTAEQLIQVLANNGGSRNLTALKELLIAQPYEDNQGQPQTYRPLDELIMHGFTTEQLIQVLAHPGSAKTMTALLELMQNKHFLTFINDNQENQPLSSLYSLANYRSRSTAINTLNKFFNHDECVTHIQNNQFFAELCSQLKISAKKLNELPITTETLDKLCAFKKGTRTKAAKKTSLAKKTEVVINTKKRSSETQTDVGMHYQNFREKEGTESISSFYNGSSPTLFSASLADEIVDSWFSTPDDGVHDDESGLLMNN